MALDVKIRHTKINDVVKSFVLDTTFRKMAKRIKKKMK